jgi:hypothetical protein
MLVLEPLTIEQIKYIFSNKVAKYLSQNRINRHYIIKYNTDGTFTNDTFECNNMIGSSYGTYSLSENENKEVFITIKYTYVFTSPHINSPFNKDNSFYPELFNGYTIGPLYGKMTNNQQNMIPILYPHLQLNMGFKILNFY